MPEEKRSRFDGISVVVPFYQNEVSVIDVHRRLAGVMDSIHLEYEMVYVNDGSRDSTAEKLKGIWRENDRVTVLNFARNFGQRSAWTAGLSEARGSIVVTIDGDGQLDPADIPKLLEPLSQGMDVSSGWRVDRHDPALRKIGSWLANWSVRKLGRVKLKDFGCSLRAYRGDFLDQLDFGVHRLYDKAAALSLTDDVADVPVSHLPPKGSGWTWINLVRYWADNLITFGDQFFLRVGLWAFGSLLVACLALALVLLGIDLAPFSAPLILLSFSLTIGFVSLVGLAAARAIKAAQGQNCYMIKTRLSRRWNPEKTYESDRNRSEV
jgi:glycosyltransferase involved in cell wall biosynthesis